MTFRHFISKIWKSLHSHRCSSSLPTTITTNIWSILQTHKKAHLVLSVHSSFTITKNTAFSQILSWFILFLICTSTLNTTSLAVWLPNYLDLDPLCISNFVVIKKLSISWFQQLCQVDTILYRLQNTLTAKSSEEYFNNRKNSWQNLIFKHYKLKSTTILVPSGTPTTPNHK